MKSFARVATYFLVCSMVVPISYAYAQDTTIEDSLSEEIVIEEDTESKDTIIDDESLKSEDEEVSENKTLTIDEAKALIKSIPTSSDAITGTVPKSPVEKYYDIYGRTLAFRESAKDLRASLDDRRESFEKPRTETIESYRVSKEKIYDAEMAAFDKNQNPDEDATEETTVEEIVTEESIAEDVLDEDIASEDTSSDDMTIEGATVNEEDIGLVEKDIPSDDKSIKKTVITSKDAPDFDPSHL